MYSALSQGTGNGDDAPICLLEDFAQRFVLRLQAIQLRSGPAEFVVGLLDTCGNLRPILNDGCLEKWVVLILGHMDVFCFRLNILNKGTFIFLQKKYTIQHFQRAT